MPSAGPAPAADTQPSSGRSLGRYRLFSALGQSGMGVVWKAWDTELRRMVALKQIKEEDAGGKEARERFQREARLAAKLHHPHIVAVHDVGETEGSHYLTMDFVEGRTFAAALDETRAAKRQGSRRGLERLRHEVGVLADVAGAVAYAHAQGVIHRDLEPANVLLDRDGHAFVMDFGLAKEVAAGTEAAPDAARRQRSLTLSGQVLGTPVYMSPEQAKADVGAIGACSDVWALGVMLYEVLTGETPFERAGNAWDILGAVVKDDPARPRARNRHVPAELEAVALAALEKEPARRYASASALEADLRRWLRGKPVKARARAARGMVAGLEGSAEPERQLSEALQEDPRLEEVHAALAGFAEACSDWEEAARRYEAALAIGGDAASVCKPHLTRAAPNPQPPDAALANRLRDSAFEHLRAALDLGWADAAHLRDDTDLAPLQDDTRWTELLGRPAASQPK